MSTWADSWGSLIAGLIYILAVDFFGLFVLYWIAWSMIQEVKRGTANALSLFVEVFMFTVILVFLFAISFIGFQPLLLLWR